VGRGNGVRLSLVLAVAASLAQLVAPLLAAVSCAWAAASGTGQTRRAWALLAASAACWAVGQATWAWFEHLARRELPVPAFPAGPSGPPSRRGR
jgi:hypothetical protein